MSIQERLYRESTLAQLDCTYRDVILQSKTQCTVIFGKRVCVAGVSVSVSVRRKSNTSSCVINPSSLTVTAVSPSKWVDESAGQMAINRSSAYAR